MQLTIRRTKARNPDGDETVTDQTERPAAAGGCLCGAVRYAVRGPLRPVVACHCGQCRKSSGHVFAASGARDHDLALEEDRGLRWFRSSDKARRGFCQICGSSVFWKADGSDYTAIAAGTLELPTGLDLVAHIFVADAGDYYVIEDGLPQLPAAGHGVEIPSE